VTAEYFSEICRLELQEEKVKLTAPGNYLTKTISFQYLSVLFQLEPMALKNFLWELLSYLPVHPYYLGEQRPMALPLTTELPALDLQGLENSSSR
jgi:hypothetical protein